MLFKFAKGSTDNDAHLHCVVSQVVVNDVRPAIAVHLISLIPHRPEPQHMPVVVDELAQRVLDENVRRLAEPGFVETRQVVVPRRRRA